MNASTAVYCVCGCLVSEEGRRLANPAHESNCDEQRAARVEAFTKKKPTRVVAAPLLTRNLTNARHLVDQAVFSIHALMKGTGPTPMVPALTSISGALQQALAELGEVEAGIGLAVHVLGGVR